MKVGHKWCKPSVRQVDLLEPEDGVPVELLVLRQLAKGAQINLLDRLVELVDFNQCLHSLSDLLWWQ